MTKKSDFKNWQTLPMIMEDKIPPSAVDIEKLVLGSLMADCNAYDRIVDILKEEYFYKESHRIIFSCITTLYKNFEGIDSGLVITEIQRRGEMDVIGGVQNIFDISNSEHNPKFIEDYAKVVVSKYLRRKNIELSYKNINDSYNEYEVSSSELINNLYDQSQAMNMVVLNRPEEINGESVLQEHSDVVTFHGLNFLSVGNISGIIAAPGSGKSNIADAIVAKAFNANCDGLGFEVNLHGKGVYHIDTERSHNDTKNGYERMKRRIDVERHPELINEKGTLHNYKIERYKEIANIDDRKNRLQRMIMTKNFKLIIIDGITDLMRNPMEPEESQDIVGWLGAMASRFEVAILCTVHNNPKTDSKSDNKGAPRGHIGSELHRKAEGMLFVDKVKEDRDIKILTNIFEFAKLRNDGGSEEHFFKWDKDKKHMFLTVDNFKKPSENPKKNLEIQNAMDAIMVGGRIFKGKPELSKALIEEHGISKGTAYEWIKKSIENDWIQQDTKGNLSNGSTPF